jgi:hypothetical protein
MRLRAHLLIQDRLDSLMAIAQRLNGDARPHIELVRAQVRRGRLQVKLTATLHHRDGSPIVVNAHPNGYWLDPAFTEDIPGVPENGWEVGNPLEHTVLTVRVHDPAAQTAWFPPTKVTRSLQHLEGNRFAIVLSATALVDPRGLGGGLGAGSYDIKVGLEILGLGCTGHPAGPNGPLRLRVDDRGRAAGPRRPLRLPRVAARVLRIRAVRLVGFHVLRALPSAHAERVRRFMARLRRSSHMT